MRITLEPAQCAALGIPPEDTTVTLPDDWHCYTAAERRAWLRGEMATIALDILDDLGLALHGRLPTQAEQLDYLKRITPALDGAMARARR